MGGTWETIAIPCGVGGRREGCRKPSWIPTTPTTSRVEGGSFREHSHAKACNLGSALGVKQHCRAVAVRMQAGPSHAHAFPCIMPTHSKLFEIKLNTLIY